MNIALCGGTFDPFHRGHLEPLLAVREAMGWERVIYIPARRQPFKSEGASASGFHRFAMACAATAGYDFIWVSPSELERTGVSYTVDTLEALRSAWPDATLDWIVGDDNLARLGEWKSLGRIFELANFAVLTRAGAAAPPAFASRVAEARSRPPHGAIVFAENRAIPVSSTEIRLRVRRGESIDALVDARVARYIHHNLLYLEGEGST